MKNETLHKVISSEYKLGFETIVNSETFPPGLNEDVIKAISAKKEEPQWLLDYRLKAYKKWLKMIYQPFLSYIPKIIGHGRKIFKV